MTRAGLVKWLAAALALLLAYAWIDGGREPLHEIVEPVAVPDAGMGAGQGAGIGAAS